MYPTEYLYSKDHEWVYMEDNIATIGITEFAQHELGEVVFVELPEVGQVFDDGEEIGTIESVKAVAEVYTPLAGEIVAVNHGVEDEPELLNDDPHFEGWLVKIKLKTNAPPNELLSAEAYEEYVKSSQE